MVYTSHYMEEVEQICDRVTIMDHGRALAQGTCDELKRSIKTGRHRGGTPGGIGNAGSHRIVHRQTRARPPASAPTSSTSRSPTTCSPSRAKPASTTSPTFWRRCAQATSAWGASHARRPPSTTSFSRSPVASCAIKEERPCGPPLQQPSARCCARRAPWYGQPVFPIVLATVFNLMLGEPHPRVRRAIDARMSSSAWRASPFSRVIDALATQKRAPAARHPRRLNQRRPIFGERRPGRRGFLGSIKWRAPTCPRPTTRAATHPITSTAPSPGVHPYQLPAKPKPGCKRSPNNPAALENASAIEAALSQTVDVITQVSLTRARPDAMVPLLLCPAGHGLHLRRPARRAKRVAPALHRLRRGSPARRLRNQPHAPTCPHHRGMLGRVDRFSSNCLWLYLPYRDIDFAGREPLCLIESPPPACFLAAWAHWWARSPVAWDQLPRGLLTAVTVPALAVCGPCSNSPTMELSDSVAKAFPAVTWINPVCPSSAICSTASTTTMRSRRSPCA